MMKNWDVLLTGTPETTEDVWIKEMTMGTKGSWTRPCSVSREELKLRHDRMEGKISDYVFDRAYQILKKMGRITRNGRMVR